jgi:hypothetical protein
MSTDNHKLYHKNIHNNIAREKKLTKSIIFSFFDNLLKKLSCNHTFGNALKSLKIGRENEKMNNTNHKIDHFMRLSFNRWKSEANSIVLIYSNT